MTLWIGLFFLALGTFLIASPRTWYRLNAPAGQKRADPGTATLRSIRRRGIPFLLGGALLLLLSIAREVLPS